MLTAVAPVPGRVPRHTPPSAPPPVVAADLDGLKEHLATTPGFSYRCVCTRSRRSRTMCWPRCTAWTNTNKPRCRTIPCRCSRSSVLSLSTLASPVQMTVGFRDGCPVCVARVKNADGPPPKSPCQDWAGVSHGVCSRGAMGHAGVLALGAKFPRTPSGKRGVSPPIEFRRTVRASAPHGQFRHRGGEPRLMPYRQPARRAPSGKSG